MTNDWTALIDASLDVDGSDAQWQARILAGISRGLGVAFAREIDAIRDRSHASPDGCCNDATGMAGCDARLCGLFGMAVREPLDAVTRDGLRWSRLVAQIRAGWRLRRCAQALSQGRADASDAPRDALRDATLRGLSAVSHATGRSAEHWDALLGGYWTLVDRFDRDGQRFYVAIGCDPRFPDPRRLSPRERQVADCIGRGRSLKDIAHALGLSLSAVCHHARRVQAKLGLGSLAQLAAFLSPNGLRRRLAEIDAGGLMLLAGAHPLLSETAAGRLSAAERELVLMVAGGVSNAEIAHRRGSSARTVANQLQSVYRKFGARSRSDLVHRLQAED